MPPSVPSLSTNSFNNSQTLLGQLAQAINNTRILGAILGGSDTLQVGARVKIDTTVTTPGVVKVIAAADNEAAFGVLIYTPQKDSIAPGDNCEVAFAGGACVIEVGGATLTPGSLVGLSSGFLVATDGTHNQMGLLLDYVTESTPGRVIVGWQAV